jgi:phospholipid-binding lipoprotein MlaA
MIRLSRSAIIPALLGLLFISACAHTTMQSSSSSFQAGSDSTSVVSDVSLALKDQKTDEDKKEAIEEAPFEEDPFEEDPFGNADSDDEPAVQVADPLIGWNRIMFHINDKLYFWVLKPVSKGYRVVIPTKVRIGLKNFFTNLLGPLRFTNCLLQNKGEAAEAELVRFVMNSTIGVLGFGNPAKKYPNLALNDEDFGQTFGRWGIGQGFYIVWPVLGPSTLRDSFGMVGDSFLKPYYYVEPRESILGLWALDRVNTVSFHIGDWESFKEMALDPYEASRDFHIQYRKNQVAK